jgi:hypothetical protein
MRPERQASKQLTCRSQRPEWSVCCAVWPCSAPWWLCDAGGFKLSHEPLHLSVLHSQYLSGGETAAVSTHCALW